MHSSVGQQIAKDESKHGKVLQFLPCGGSSGVSDSKHDSCLKFRRIALDLIVHHEPMHMTCRIC